MKFDIKKMPKSLYLILPVLLGILIAFVLVKTKEGPQKKDITIDARKVRVITLKEMRVQPKTIGYGSIQPSRVWQAVARVSGNLTFTSPLFEKGQRVKKGTLLAEIDPTEYKLSIAQSEASILSIQAQMNQLKDKETSNKELLKIEEASLKLSAKELKRQGKLVADKISSRSVYDKEERSFNSQKYKVQSLKNSLNSMKSDLQLLKAQEKQAKAQLESARVQLVYTKIRAPYDCLISNVSIEQSQYVQRGQVIAQADSIGAVEIEAQFSNGRHVVASHSEKIDPHSGINDSKTIGERLGLSAIVRPAASDMKVEWVGKVLRFNASIDPQTRTPGIIIQVERPTKPNSNKRAVPLVKGMYCEVELIGQQLPKRLVVPRSAVHDNNMVYLVDSENKMRRRYVSIEFSQDTFSVIKSGLKIGDMVVVTDLIPAIEGMKLMPVLDTELTQLMDKEVTGGVE